MKTSQTQSEEHYPFRKTEKSVESNNFFNVYFQARA